MTFPLRTSRRATAVLAVALCAAGCEGGDQPAPQPESPAVAGNPPNTVDDAHVVAIVSAADSVQVAVSELGAEKADSPEVKEFARMVIRDHNASRLQSQQLFTTLGVQPGEHPASRQLAQAGERALAVLEERSGAEFDRDFMAFQVAQHQALLGVLDDTLIPAATPGEMETLLRSTRTAVAAHLEQARQVQAGLAREGVDTTEAT